MKVISIKQSFILLFLLIEKTVLFSFYITLQWAQYIQNDYWQNLIFQECIIHNLSMKQCCIEKWSSQCQEYSSELKTQRSQRRWVILPIITQRETCRVHLQNNLKLENVPLGNQYGVHSPMQEYKLYIYSESWQFSLKCLQLGVEQKHSIHI